jgi:2-methylisocitrate lyase-like PEP mutase family enzyme
VILPGAYDGLSARLVEAAGFDAVYMTGFGSTATLLGKPDVGLLSGSEMADNARRDPDLVLIARTDAIAVDGVDAAIERARAYLAAGADALVVEAPTTEADVERIAGELAGEAPLVFNRVEGGRTPPIDVETRSSRTSSGYRRSTSRSVATPPAARRAERRISHPASDAAREGLRH